MKIKRIIRFLVIILVIASPIHIRNSFGIKQSDKKPLTVLTYNINGYQPRHPQRVAALMRELKNSNADVIALQEVGSWFFQRIMSEPWVRQRYHGIVFPIGGLYTLSRYPIQKVTYRDFPSKSSRKLLITHIAMHDRVVAVANVHLESPLEDNFLRAKQLDITFQELRDAKYSVLLGDFNFGDHEQPETAYIEADFQDIWSSLNPGKEGFTWDMRANNLARINAFRGEQSRRLDRILVRADEAQPYDVSIIGKDPLRYSASSKVVYKDKVKVKKKVRIKKKNKTVTKIINTWKYRTRVKYKPVQHYEFPSDHFGLKGTVLL